MIKCRDCGSIVIPDPPSDGFDYTSTHCSPLANLTAGWISDWWKDRGAVQQDDPHLSLAVYVLERLFPIRSTPGANPDNASTEADDE